MPLKNADRLFRWLTAISAFSILAVMCGFFIQLFLSALPAFQTFGGGFLFSSQWDPNRQLFGAFPAILGTVLTTFIAVLIALPASFFIAFLLVEKLPPSIAKPIGHAVDLLAAVPSIIYGMWGFLVLLPLMQLYIQPCLQTSLNLSFGEKPAVVSTPSGNAALLDGKAGFFNIAPSSYLNYANDFTSLMTFCPDVLGKELPLVWQKETFSLRILPGGEIFFNGAVSDSRLSPRETVTLCAVRKGNMPELWVNGQKWALKTDSVHFAAAEGHTPLLFGHDGKDFFKGTLQTFRHYSRALDIGDLSTGLFENVQQAEAELDAHSLEAAWQFNTGLKDGVTSDILSGLRATALADGFELNIFRSNLFSGTPAGGGILSAGMILALMILPFISAVMRDIFKMTPSVVKESAYGLGATDWETTRDITLRYGLQGFLGALFLGLGRALGETMAVLFIIGNAPYAGVSLFAPASTIASTLANSFAEADGIFRNVLFALGFILLAISFFLQIAAQWWLNSVRKKQGARS